ncbi:putative methyltransferase, LIC12133 family [Pedobacter sp. ok626]|nr:putative methyltransferase, LIC12133 family [Pedobacter sp. ok626]
MEVNFNALFYGMYMLYYSTIYLFYRTSIADMFKIKNFFKKKPKNVNPYGWFGNYNTWDEAKSSASGYEAGNILEKTKQSLLKIKNGEATYERDSVLFDKKEYPYAIISSLLYIAVKNGNKLNVIDFGGSLGSTWFQVRDFILSGIEVAGQLLNKPFLVTYSSQKYTIKVLN